MGANACELSQYVAMTTPSRALRSRLRTEVEEAPAPVDDTAMYAAVAARRTQSDALLWQVPALSMTAQAFLFTISLGSDTGRLARVVAALLSMLIGFMSLELMSRHRRAELVDAEWMEAYEKRRWGETMHGGTWKKRRDDAHGGGPLGSIPAFTTWWIGLAIFMSAALVIFVIALVSPQSLAATHV